MRTPRSEFRLNGEGYDREDVDAFVCDVEQMVARWQQHAASPGAAVVNSQQSGLIAEPPRRPLETLLASTMPALQELQEVLRTLESGPSSATASISPAAERRGDPHPIATGVRSVGTQLL